MTSDEIIDAINLVIRDMTYMSRNANNHEYIFAKKLLERLLKDITQDDDSELLMLVKLKKDKFGNFDFTYNIKNYPLVFSYNQQHCIEREKIFDRLCSICKELYEIHIKNMENAL